jgi:hypothetical protein
MTHAPLSIAATLFASTCLSVSNANADDSTPTEVPECGVKLVDADVRAITLEVLKEHPLLSASPGLKYADAMCGYSSDVDVKAATPSLIMANVIFYPHTETRGIKQAFEAHCQRSASSLAWSCFAVEIRRYVKLESQDFEVRVKGELDLAGIQAVIEATRQPAAAAALQSAEVADTASSIFDANGGYVVSWGDKNGMGRIGLEAHLREGGNPANPNDWDINELPVL